MNSIPLLLIEARRQRRSVGDTVRHHRSAHVRVIEVNGMADFVRKRGATLSFHHVGRETADEHETWKIAALTGQGSSRRRKPWESCADRSTGLARVGTRHPPL